VAGLDRDPAVFWPEPLLVLEAEEHPGPVLVALFYTIGDETREEFLRLMPALRRVRRRTGATSWHLYVDAAQPDRFVEIYTVASWAEHMLQHGGRLTGSDREIDLAARGLSKEPVLAYHLFTAQLPDA
jgi:hypothetical protein